MASNFDPFGKVRSPSSAKSLSYRVTRTGLAAGGALLLGLALLPPATVYAGVAVTLLTVVGYAALLALLYLFLFPIRLRRIMPGGSMTLGLHRQIGYATLFLAAFHAAGYLVLEPVSWHDLLLSAPIYMVAGTVALLGLIAVGLTSRDTTRLRLTHSALGFRGQHLISSAVILILAGLHAGGAGLALDASWKMRIWAGIATIAVIGLLRQARHPKGER